jgi:hypothetical protein
MSEMFETMLPDHVVDPSTGQVLTRDTPFEEYIPRKMLGDCPVYYGPDAPLIGHCLCGLKYYYVANETRKCICCSQDKENNAKILAEQPELNRWYNIHRYFRRNQEFVSAFWIRKMTEYRFDFDELMDTIVPGGCYPCYLEGKYCFCRDCSGCGSKNCSGLCEEDYDY